MNFFVPYSIRKAALVIIALAGLNALLLTLAAHPADLPTAEWRKGPVIHKDSFYGPARAPQYFWLFSALFLDLYALAAWGLGIALVRPGRHGSTRRLLAATGALVIATASTEYAVRRTAAGSKPGHFRPHADVFYYNRPLLRDSREFPNALPESTSSRGFRGRDEFPTLKPPGEYRIFVVGDSSAFGHGVLDNETFSAQLESILREQVHGPIRVINAACPGHCTYEGLIIYRQMGVPLDADLVIVSYNNDASPEYQEEKKRSLDFIPVKFAMRFLYKSDFFLLFQRTVANAALRLQFKKNAQEPPTVPRVSREDYIRNLLAFQEEASRHGARAVYVNMPINHEMLKKRPDRRIFYNPAYPQSLIDLCRQNNLPMADVDGELTQTPTPDVFLPGHHFHPSAAGHRLIAEQIAPVIIPLVAERMKMRTAILPGATIIQTSTGPLEGAPTDPQRDHTRGAPKDMPEWRNLVRFGYSTLTPLHALMGETLHKTPAAVSSRLRYEFLTFLHGKDQDEACNQGLVDLTFSCEVPAIIHLDKHRDLAVLGSAGELGNIALLVNGASHIRRTAQLKGKTVAVADGASARLLLEQRLANAGLDPVRDVKTILFRGGTTEPIEALNMGTADAVVLWDPWLTEYSRGRDLRVLESSPFWSLILVSKNYAKNHPENMQNMLQDLRKALDWAKTHPDSAVFLVAQASGLSPATVRSVLNSNSFLQTNAPSEFSLNPAIIQRLRACRAYAIQNNLASPDAPLSFIKPPHHNLGTNTHHE